MKTHVVKIGADATLAEAVDLMDLYQAGGLPVVDDAGRLCGMVTEADVWRALFRAAAPTELAPANSLFSQSPSGADTTSKSTDLSGALGTGPDTSPLFAPSQRACIVAALRVRDWMTTPAIFVSEHENVGSAARILIERGLKRLPVVNEDRQVVGMLNRVDVMQGLFEGLL